MKKLVNFLNLIEDKLLIRFGRRIWQFVGLLAILVLIVSIILIVRNLIPTERNEVHISKKEYNENKIDSDFDDSNNLSSCSKSEYTKALDSLKREMPKSEWVKLSTTERVERYREVTRYDPWYGSYTTYEPYYEWEETKNYNAIPVILEGIYDSKGIDSGEFCDQIKVVRAITALMKQTKKDIATEVLKNNIKYLIVYNDLQKSDVDRSISIYKNVNGKKPFIVNPDDQKDAWGWFYSYLNLYTSDSINIERDQIAIDATNKLKNKGIKKIEYKNGFAYWVLSNEMDDEATKVACEDLFQNSILKFNEKNYRERVGKYLNLYIQKYHLAESLKQEEDLAKEENVELFGSTGIVSFGAILAIASILILYSIRQILKDKKD